MKQPSIHFIWKEPHITRRFESGVALHSHTVHSRNRLGALKRRAGWNPVLAVALRRLERKYAGITGKKLDLDRCHITLPVQPGAAFRLERDPIASLGLRPLVSITDHDSIAASRTLLTLSTPAEAPVSLEWTAPFGAGYFHVGVHNLPVTFAGEIVEALLDTRCAYCQTFGASSAGRHDERCLPHVQDWMNRLSSIPDTLLVLNHPLRDLSGLGHTAHRRLLTSFLLRHRKHLHAIELNAMRSWAENQDVLEVSSEFGLPVVSGGDRHGSEPSAALNLTMATGFSEFAREIRSGKPPVVLFTRQYRRPLTLRKLQVAWEFLKASAPPAGGAARWSDRVFVPWRDGRALPLSAREWSGSFANELIAGRESPKGLPGDAMNRAEH